MKQLIVITGPTASGKTSLAVQLAKRLSTDVISADSRQFYKEMAIGTARPTEEEMEGVRHHFVGQVSIRLLYTVGQYEREVLNLLEDFFKKKDVIILVGGSGLFVRAICEGLDEFPDVSPTKRDWVRESYEKNGLEWLQDQIREKDPVYFQQVDKRNPQRLMRALEVIETSGRAFSSFHKTQRIKRNFTVNRFGIEWDRAELYDRINRRVDWMIDNGLLEEAKSLLAYRDVNALQTVGYTELFDYFQGVHDLDEAIRLIKRNSRRYAKRQLTWLRKEEGLHWLPSTGSIAMMVNAIVESVNK